MDKKNNSRKKLVTLKFNYMKYEFKAKEVYPYGHKYDCMNR